MIGGEFEPEFCQNFSDRSIAHKKSVLVLFFSFIGEDTFRGERNAAAEDYIPTFFTSQQNHEALTAARNPQQKRQVGSQEPLYYETYHNRR